MEVINKILSRFGLLLIKEKDLNELNEEVRHLNNDIRSLVVPKSAVDYIKAKVRWEMAYSTDDMFFYGSDSNTELKGMIWK